MEFALLTVVTGSRWLCPPLWAWLWFRTPTARVIVGRLAVILWFVVTDYYDGQYARAHHLESSFGAIIDHGVDVLFCLTILALAVAPDPIRRRSPVGRLRPDE